MVGCSDGKDVGMSVGVVEKSKYIFNGCKVCVVNNVFKIFLIKKKNDLELSLNFVKE